MEEIRLTTRVHAGARLLDEKDPGWASLVDTDVLDMGSWTNCPLGQIYGDYRLGLAALNLNVLEESHEHGFDNYYGTRWFRNELEWAWTNEVKKRLRWTWKLFHRE